MRRRSLSLAVDLVELDVELATDAATLVPVTLRTLDAIHLATAMRVRAAVPTFVAYDSRLLTAARDLGLRTARPVSTCTDRFPRRLRREVARGPGVPRTTPT